MTPDSVMNLGEQALQVTVLLSAPILLSALAIGFIVAMFQACLLYTSPSPRDRG